MAGGCIKTDASLICGLFSICLVIDFFTYNEHTRSGCAITLFKSLRSLSPHFPPCTAVCGFLEHTNTVPLQVLVAKVTEKQPIRTTIIGNQAIWGIIVKYILVLYYSMVFSSLQKSACVFSKVCLKYWMEWLCVGDEPHVRSPMMSDGFKIF